MTYKAEYWSEYFRRKAMTEQLKFCPFCKSKQLEVVKIDMKDPSRDLIKCRHCRGQVMRYNWDTRHITKADAEAYCRDNGLIIVPVEPTEAMISKGHNEIDWCRNYQNTEEVDHESQTLGGSTSCKTDITDAYKAMIAAFQEQAL